MNLGPCIGRGESEPVDHQGSLNIINLFIFNGRIIALQYTVGFCHTSTWISHRTPVFLPGESQGRGSLVGCRLWGRTESDTTERLRFHFSLSCIGEGNGSPLQCSCWRIPGTGEPGGLPSMGPHWVRHDWSNLAAAAYICLLPLEPPSQLPPHSTPLDCQSPGLSSWHYSQWWITESISSKMRNKDEGAHFRHYHST